MSRARLGIAAWCLGLAACGSCQRDASTDAGPPSASAPPAAVVAERSPRCRVDAQRLALPGEDVVVGDVAIGPSGLLIGVVRVVDGRAVASVVRASLDLGTSRVVDVGPSLGDDPPPSPRWVGDAAHVAFVTRRPRDAGAKARALTVAPLGESALGDGARAILQQADESTAFDVAWSDGAGLVAWDEDAPPSAAGEPRPASSYAPEGRGIVKVEALGSGARRVASPASSDAEAPRLLARPGGGFWLAWLARRAEGGGYAVESPGESPAFRWVEVVPLGPAGEPAGPVKRVSPETGRAAAFDLAYTSSGLVVMVQDEASPSEGAGARVVRYLVGEELRGADVIDGGVGATIAELVPAPPSSSEAVRWLAWTDTSEGAHLTRLGEGLVAAGGPSAEPALDGARVLAASAPDVVYALVGLAPTAPAVAPRPEVRRFVCPRT